MASLSSRKDLTILTFPELSIILQLKGNICDERLLEQVSTNSKDDIDNYDGNIPIICSALSQSGDYFISCIHKDLYLWRTCDWTLLSKRLLNRSASAVTFVPKEDRIAVADKSGDVFLLSVESPEKDGELILGHVSMLLNILVTPNSKYIITSDRDEKIRVSFYPNAYNIQSYCLGHEEFVTCLTILPHNENILVSGSGDGTIRFWEYEFGRELLCYFCDDAGLDEVENKPVITKFTSVKIIENESLLCLQLLYFKGILVYKVSSQEKNELKCIFNQVIILESEPWCLQFSDQYLWILKQNSNDCLSAFTFSKDKSEFILSEILTLVKPILEKRCNFLEKVFKKDRQLSTLYKRRFDNVQEYLKRKMIRLQTGAKKSKKVLPGIEEIP